ncbi:MAG: hypothetical protein R3349_07845, partial [Geminicoccaceae bacterium]|nr:hypothetical protein [Geminicoccaceae bacterium]
SRPAEELDQVIYEMIPQGSWVRVTAMHEPTLTEIVVRGPASAGVDALQRLAHDRLLWVMRRQGKPRT